MSVLEKIILTKGDITLQTTEAIVNAANNSLLGGGGVDGAIHRAGGPQILEECKKIGGCKTGHAVITSGGNLKAKYVIHTVGPVWHGGNNKEDELLQMSYLSCLKLAEDKGIKSISFPSISTGAYGFPVDRAAKLALNTVYSFLEGGSCINKVIFVLFSDRDYDIYTDAWNQLYQKTR